MIIFVQLPNDEFAPKGWNYEKYGRPTISFWEYPKGLSREPADVRRRFDAAWSKEALVPGYAGTEGVRITSREDILERHNPEWFKQHSVRLIEELEQISEM